MSPAITQGIQEDRILPSGAYHAENRIYLSQHFGKTFWLNIPRCQVETSHEIGQVVGHQFGGVTELMPGQRVNESMMSLTFAGDVTPPPIQSYDKGRARHEISDKFRQDRMCGDLGDCHMEPCR